MNEQLRNFAKKELKNGLARCTLEQQETFKAMYNKGDYMVTIDHLVDNIVPEEKLDWAMEQVRRTLEKNQ